MKTTQLYLLIGLVTIFSFSSYAQVEKNDSLKYAMDENYAIPYDSLSAIDKLNYNFGFGAMIMSNGSFGTYYSPSVSYQLNKKWSILGGILYQNIHADNLPTFTEFGYQPFNGNISQFYGYVAAKYKVDERWTVGGSVFYNMTDFNNPYYSYSSSNISSFDRIGYSGFVEYRSPGGGFTLSGEIRVNDQFNPYSQFGGFNTGFGTGFGGGFGSPYSPW